MVIKKAESHKLRKKNWEIQDLVLYLWVYYTNVKTEMYQVPTFNASWKTGTPGWYVQASGQKQKKNKTLYNEEKSSFPSVLTYNPFSICR